MATQMGILSCGIILTLTVLTVLLPILTAGNVIDQRVLQRELGENSPEIMSMSDKDDVREIEDSAVEDYSMKKREDQNLDMALIAEYIFAKQMMMNRLRARTESFRPQKKRSYWKQCAFNAVSCFG